jgi:hypothetical protein
MDVSGRVGHESGPFVLSYNTRDLLIYAHGIGCSLAHNELKYLAETHEDFAAFPTFPLVLPFKGTSSDVVEFPGPTLALLPDALAEVASSVLHYSQGLTLLKQLEPDGGALTATSRIVGIHARYYNAHCVHLNAV